MNLQFIIGQETADKQAVMYRHISDILGQNPSARVFVIIPEHAKFEAEMTILKNIWQSDPVAKNEKMLGAMRLQVFSFSRLAWFLLRNSPEMQRPGISDVGIGMLIRKVLLEQGEDLIIFRREMNKPGFIKQLRELFKEFRSGRITIEYLLEMLDQEAEDNTDDFKQKLKEITLIYEAFNSVLDHRYFEHDNVLDALYQKIFAEDMPDTYVFISGYHHFNAKELQVVNALLCQTEQVTILLALDKGYPQEGPQPPQLFYDAGNTYHRLYQMARSQKIPVRKDIIVRKDTDGYHEEMLALERYWIQSNQGFTPGQRLPDLEQKEPERIRIWRCENKQTEIFHVANEIKRLVLDEGYRYKDIRILARKVEDYETILKPMFRRADLDVFYDKADAMKNHPFMDFIDSLFHIRIFHWRYRDIMRLLRAELLVPVQDYMEEEPFVPEFRREEVKSFRERVDITENILLAYGLEGNDWLTEQKWQFHFFDELADEAGMVSNETANTGSDQQAQQIANEIKDFLQETLVPFYQKMKQARTGREAATLLFQFLEDNGIDRQLLFWRDQALEQNDLVRARNEEKVWKTFVSILDEYVEVLGETPFDPAMFHEIIMTGFENAEFSIVPPSIDQVVFTSMEAARYDASKVVFLLGATDDQLPRQKEVKSLLNDEERQLFNDTGDANRYIYPTAQESLASEPYIAYQTFMSATDRLYITYPMLNEDSRKTPKLSPYVQRLMEALRIPLIYMPADISDSPEPDRFLGNKDQNIRMLVQLFRHQKKDQQELPLLWQSIFRYLARDKEVRPRMEKVFSSLWHRNVPVPLTEEIAGELYGKDLYLSVSQLESYYEDPYSHFLQYGLRLRERAQYELSPAGTGEFFHEALQYIVDQVRGKGPMTEEQVRQVADQVLNGLYGNQKYAILSSSNRMLFIRDQLQETIHKMAWVLHQQKHRTPLTTVRTEAIFGIPGPDSLEGLELSLLNGGQLHLRGKIDRIDTIQVNDQPYLSILDYKSSAHSFDFTEAYYGLAMQMLTYLDVALKNSAKLGAAQPLPGGAFYLHVKNPYLKENRLLTLEDYLRQNLKEYSYKGILLADLQLLSELDPDVSEGDSSLIFPFGLLKDGRLGKKKELVTLKDIELLLEHNRQKMKEAGENILAGKLELSPIKDRLYTPTVYGPYRAVSQFDNTLPENRYRKLEKKSKDEILELIRNELEEENNE